MGPRCDCVGYRSSCGCRRNVKRVLRGCYVAVPTFVRRNRTIEREIRAFRLSFVCALRVVQLRTSVRPCFFRGAPLSCRFRLSLERFRAVEKTFSKIFR